MQTENSNAKNYEHNYLSPTNKILIDLSLAYLRNGLIMICIIFLVATILCKILICMLKLDFH